MKEKRICKLKKLEEFGKYSFDPNDIYIRYYGFTIKTYDHKIYSIGFNDCQQCGIGLAQDKIDTFTQINMTNINTNINIIMFQSSQMGEVQIIYYIV